MDAQGKAFWQWLKNNGVEISDKVALHDYSSEGQGRGVVALQDIAKNEIIFSIPRSLVLAVDNDPGFAHLVSGENDQGPWLNLMAYMMVCAHQEHWKPYFDVLPSKFNTPMFWNQTKARELLQGSALVDKIGKEEAEEKWNEMNELFKDPVFQDCDTSVDAFHRMGSLIMSYSFDVKAKAGNSDDGGNDVDSDDEEEQAVKAMAPPADMLNAHTRLCNAHLHHPNENSDVLEMRAIKDIRKGEQVYNTYGELPNSDLMRRYGYVECGGTEFDVAEVSTELIVDALDKLGIMSNSALEPVLEQMRDENEFYDDAFDIGVSGEPDMPAIVVMEYLCLVSEVDNTKRLLKQCAKMAEDDTLSDRGKQVWQRVMEMRLRQYPQEVVESAVQNPDPEPTSSVIVEPEAMAREVLLGEVRILNRSIQWCQSVDVIDSQKILDKVAKPSKRQKIV